MSFCQITALPRSGTAFITVLMNLAPNCLAFHELVVTDPHWKMTLEVLARQAAGTHNVICDVGTYQFMPKAQLDEFQGPRVYVRQDPQQSLEKAEKAFGYEVPLIGLQHASEIAEEWAASNVALVIEQHDLFTIASLESIWRHCNPVAGFPAQKVAILLQMQIQRLNGDKVFAKDALKGREGELWES